MTLSDLERRREGSNFSEGSALLRPNRLTTAYIPMYAVVWPRTIKVGRITDWEGVLPGGHHAPTAKGWGPSALQFRILYLCLHPLTQNDYRYVRQSNTTHGEGRVSCNGVSQASHSKGQSPSVPQFWGSQAVYIRGVARNWT